MYFKVPFRRKKKIGLALGSGSARGVCHIGVIEALEEEGFEIDFVAGSSAGAAIGAIYLSGKLPEYKKFLLSMDWKAAFSFFDLTLPYSGFINGTLLKKLIKKYLVSGDDFKHLKKPLSIIATNILDGQEIVIDKGSISSAIRASISLPGIMVPVKKDDMLLADGGLVNPVPSDIVRKMGADTVIAVDLNSHLLKYKFKQYRYKSTEAIEDQSFFSKLFSYDFSGPGIFDVMGMSMDIMLNQITQRNYKFDKPDIIIEPQLENFGLFNFDRSKEAIEEGYKKTKEKMKEIKKYIR